MPPSTWCAAGVCILATALVACAPGSTSTSHPAVGHDGAVAANPPVPNVCDSKIIAPADLVGVLSGTITTKTVPGDPQTCEFSSDGFSSVSVSVRPGLGDVTVAEWTGGRMPANAGTIDGIGDRAAWQGTLHELIATRHNVLCDIGSHGTKGTDADLQKTFGQLCGKIWAAR